MAYSNLHTDFVNYVFQEGNQLEYTLVVNGDGFILNGKLSVLLNCYITGPHGLTFTCWGCYGLFLRHKPSVLAHSFYTVLMFISGFLAISTVFHLIKFETELTASVLKKDPKHTRD